AISACEKGGRWVRAMSLLDELGWRGVHPDTITYNAAASACEKRSCWLPALEILSQAPEPNSLTFAAAIAAVSTEGHRWALVLGLLTTMIGLRMQPTADSSSASAEACEKGGQRHSLLSLLVDVGDWTLLRLVASAEGAQSRRA
ncbi:unnamed protein product, partial [Polarella glacialis]